MHAGCTHAGCTHKKKGGPCPATYSQEVQAALIKVWEMFDYPCGQRLAPALRQEIERLRRAKELICPEDVAGEQKWKETHMSIPLFVPAQRVRGVRPNPNAPLYPPHRDIRPLATSTLLSCCPTP